MEEVAYLADMGERKTEIKKPDFRGAFGAAYSDWIDAEDEVDRHSRLRSRLFEPSDAVIGDYSDKGDITTAAADRPARPQLRATDHHFTLKARLAHEKCQRLVEAFYSELIKPDCDPKILLTMVSNIVRDPAGLDAWRSDSRFLQILSLLEARITEKLGRSFSIDIEAKDGTAKDAKETLESNRGQFYSALQKLLYPVVGLIRSFRSPDTRIADKQARVLELIERLRNAMGVKA